MAAPRQRVAIVTRLPADLAGALAARHDCLAHDPAGGAIPGVSVAVTTSMAGGNAALFDSLPDLRLLACQGTGLDRIDMVEAERRGIVVAHTPDILTIDVAEFAIGLMMATARRIVEADRFVRAGRWPHERMRASERLSGKTVGIVGLGRIGEAIARRAEGLAMHVIWHGPRAKPDVQWEFVPSLRALAAQSDVMILAAPGGPDTHGMVDAEVLAALGPEGLLVNVARGSVVAEEALIAALETGGIGGAGLDVFVNEPELDPRLAQMDNVILSPHYASVTLQAREEIIALILANIDKLGDHSDPRSPS